MGHGYGREELVMRRYGTTVALRNGARGERVPLFFSCPKMFIQDARPWLSGVLLSRVITCV